MKKTIFFGASLCLSLIALFFLNKENDCPQNLYRLKDNIYLEKIDYFSHYRIIQKSGNNNTAIKDFVSRIGMEDEIIICQLDSDKKFYLILEDAEPRAYESLSLLKEMNSIPNIKLISPWQFIEGYKKTDHKKTLHEIIIIAIIIQITLLLVLLIKYLKKDKA